MPSAVDERGFSLSSFDHKTTLLVGFYCSLVIGKNTHSNAVEVQLREGVVQKQADCLASEPLAEQLTVIDRDRHGGPAIRSDYTMEFDFAD